MATAYEQRPLDASLNRLEQLFRTHYERVLRAAYRVTGDMADAEDVTQSVFLRLASSDCDIDNPESYLYRAAINGALDLLRKRVAKGETEIDAAAEIAGSAPNYSPERQFSAGELQTRLRKAIAELSPRSAEMFVLRYFEDRDTAEIAAIMQTSRAVVAVTLHVARTKLKKQFQAYKRG